MTNEIINQIVEILKKEEFISYGIVTRDCLYEVGCDDMHESFDWDHEFDCPSKETLGGVCCTGIRTLFEEDYEEEITKSLKINNGYGGKYQYLIGTNEGSRYGEDESEVILTNPTVLMIIKSN